MRKFLENAATSLAMGVFFCLGIAAAFAAIAYFDKEPARRDMVWTRFPTDLRIQSHFKVAGRPELTIRGIVRNTGQTTWRSVSIEVPVKAGGALVNQCENDIRGDFPPGASRTFDVTCHQVSGSALPDNVTYEVVVGSAGK